MLFRVLAVYLLLSVGCCEQDQYCVDSAGKTRKILEEWYDGDRVCICDYPENYLADPPPASEFSSPSPACRFLGCIDRYTGELKSLGDRMYNEALDVECRCVEGSDPYIMDQGLDDLFHWRC